MVIPGWECAGIPFAKRFEKKISEAFNPSELDALARETGFKVRESKLTPVMFLDTVLFKEADNTAVSLEDHCIALKLRYNVDIKKQSLAERFNEQATEYLEEILHRQLSQQITSHIQEENLNNELRHFTSIKIKDSTRFQVAECLKEYYPGSTGAATGAGIHIQFEFDILGGQRNILAITDALQQDAVDAEQTQDDIGPGSLIIRDLGYFSTAVLGTAHEAGAYYITRAIHRMHYYHAVSGKEINFKAVYRKMKKDNLDNLEIPILLGEKKLPNRLIIEMLPDEEVAKRIAKADKEARKKGRQLSEEYKIRARLNLFITNVPADWIPTEKVRRVYRLRWQIELRFKAWKSFYRIDAIKKMQRHRFECYLYATLLLVMINLEIGANFFAILLKHAAKPLSILKFYKTTSQQIATLREALFHCGEKLISYLALLYEISYKKLLTEQRKGHTAPLIEILLKKVD